jgi:sulfopyruvate decarboxylase alpha subunit
VSWSDVAFDALKANDFKTVVHVPDNVLADLIRAAEADDQFDVISPTREEEGIGIVCGSVLAGRRAIIMMQNSGMGNAANALASLANPYQFPFLMLISQRGELGEFNAAQVGMGQALRPMLDGLGIQHFTIERLEDVEPVITGATLLAYQTDRPVALILSPLLTGRRS